MNYIQPTMISLFISVVLVLLVIKNCSHPLSPEKLWVQEIDHKCWAAHGRSHYSETSKVFECWDRPFARHAKLIFTEKYIK